MGETTAVPKSQDVHQCWGYQVAASGEGYVRAGGIEKDVTFVEADASFKDGR
jgi:hypothetical protein